VIIVLGPQSRHIHGLLEAVKLGALQKLAQYRLPEPLDSAQGHRMVRPRVNVALPQPVGTGSFKKPWLGRVFPRLALSLLHQPLLAQGLMYNGLAGVDQEKALENVDDPTRSVLGVSLFKAHHPLPQ